MKKYIAIREDDVSYFTQPDMLDMLYHSLFKQGLPVNFCVIPQVSANIRIGGGEESLFFKQYGLRYEPFIPPVYRGQDKRYDISGNIGLIAFIRSSPVEVVQHGFNHEWNGKAEFAHNEEGVLMQRAESGREILRKAFDKPPAFFCPPWDQISREGICVVKQAGFLGVSLSRFGRYLPYLMWPAYFWNKYISHRDVMERDRFLLIRHPGCFINMFEKPHEVIKKFKKIYETYHVIVLVNHHWEYFFDWQESPDLRRLQTWHVILNSLLNNSEIEFITFSMLHRLIEEDRLY